MSENKPVWTVAPYEIKSIEVAPPFELPEHNTALYGESVAYARGNREMHVNFGNGDERHYVLVGDLWAEVDPDSDEWQAWQHRQAEQERYCPYCGQEME